MPLHPVIFLPGYSGSLLFARVENRALIPKACIGAIHVNDTINVNYNATVDFIRSSCAKALLELSFDETKGGFSSLKGIDISITDFGGKTGIIESYFPFFNTLSGWGYVLGETLFGAPFDYRYATATNLERSGLIPNLKALIETAYNRDSMKVYLVAHSNGGPTVYTFLSAMSEMWKNTYVEGYISLSGNFLGQLNAYSSFFHDHLSHVYAYDYNCTWESTYTSASFGGYTTLQNVTFLKTYTGTAQERSYTARLEDMTSLFDSIGRQYWSTRLRYLYPYMNASIAPTVNMHCLYGQVSIIYSIFM